MSKTGKHALLGSGPPLPPKSLCTKKMAQIDFSFSQCFATTKSGSGLGCRGRGRPSFCGCQLFQKMRGGRQMSCMHQ